MHSRGLSLLTSNVHHAAFMVALIPLHKWAVTKMGGIQINRRHMDRCFLLAKTAEVSPLITVSQKGGSYWLYFVSDNTDLAPLWIDIYVV
jgi:hypothetical protein